MAKSNPESLDMLSLEFIYTLNEYVNAADNPERMKELKSVMERKVKKMKQFPSQTKYKALIEIYNNLDKANKSNVIEALQSEINTFNQT